MVRDAREKFQQEEKTDKVSSSCKELSVEDSFAFRRGLAEL